MKSTEAFRKMSNKCFEYVRWGPRGGQAILTLRSLAQTFLHYGSCAQHRRMDTPQTMPNISARAVLFA